MVTSIWLWTHILNIIKTKMMFDLSNFQESKKNSTKCYKCSEFVCNEHSAKTLFLYYLFKITKEYYFNNFFIR